jgi:hypothetical protein
MHKIDSALKVISEQKLLSQIKEIILFKIYSLLLMKTKEVYSCIDFKDHSDFFIMIIHFGSDI